MLYKFNDKTLRIPDDEIKNNMKVLNLTKEEAIQLWLEDNEYIENEVVEELTKKAKINKISHEAKSSKPRKTSKPRERKPDEEKENLIKIIAECLENHGFSIEIVNKSKLIEFNVNENHYKLDLIKQRPPKKS